MKQSITKALIWLLAVSALTFTACGDDDDDDPIPGQNACALTRVMDDQGNESTFEYNAQGYVTKITEDFDGTEFVTTYIYGNNNVVTRQNFMEDGEDAGYATFKYTNGRVSEVEYFEGGNLSFTESFIYDTGNRLTEITDTDGFKITYVYDNSGNVAHTTLFIDEEIVFRIEYGNYDNKKSPYTAVKGYMNLYEPGNNNPGRLGMYNVAGEEEDLIFDATYTYQYNDQDLPTRITETSNGDVTVTTLTYQCK